MASEFNLIERFFNHPAPSALLGVGDDAALLAVAADQDLAISTDMLLAGTHFFPDTDPHKLGWKTLAVNLSDLAAMGARPRWATLALALPTADEAWLDAFSAGFFGCARRFGVDLVGGDTTRGPLALGVTVLGEVPPGKALRRDAAQAGDDIWISGTLGAAALGLTALQGQTSLPAKDLRNCLAALETPQPHVDLGLALRGVAHAAIDVSDGLLADLGHILRQSGTGAEIRFDALPAAEALLPKLEEPRGRVCLLAGGDDYVLCFTAAPRQRNTLAGIGKQLGIPLTRIGHITPDSGALHLLDSTGQAIVPEKIGYDHFA